MAQLILFKPKHGEPKLIVNSIFYYQNDHWAQEVAIQKDIEQTALAMNENKDKEQTNDIFIKHGHLLKRIRLSEIIWIRSEGNYCTIVTVQKRHVMKMSLVRILEGLPGTDFVQIHRSFVVRVDQIAYIDVQTNQVSIGGEMLPLGRTFKEALLDRINLL